MQYRLLHGYKYQILDTYEVGTQIYPTNDIICKYMSLSTNGILLIQNGYAWDGVTGLFYTPKKALIGSLIHDTLYQLIRLGYLHDTDRIECDKELERQCCQDGLHPVLCRVLYYIVRIFGGRYARVSTDPEINILEV